MAMRQPVAAVTALTALRVQARERSSKRRIIAIELKEFLQDACELKDQNLRFDIDGLAPKCAEAFVQSPHTMISTCLKISYKARKAVMEADMDSVNSNEISDFGVRPGTHVVCGLPFLQRPFTLPLRRLPFTLRRLPFT